MALVWALSPGGNLVVNPVCYLLRPTSIPSWCTPLAKHVHMEYPLPLSPVNHINHRSDRTYLSKYWIGFLPLCHQLVGGDRQQDEDLVILLDNTSLVNSYHTKPSGISGPFAGFPVYAPCSPAAPLMTTHMTPLTHHSFSRPPTHHSECPAGCILDGCTEA